MDTLDLLLLLINGTTREKRIAIFAVYNILHKFPCDPVFKGDPRFHLWLTKAAPHLSSKNALISVEEWRNLE